MKVGITCFATYGGSSTVAAELGKALAAHGHEVHFVCRDLPARLVPLPAGIHFHPAAALPYPVFEYPPYTVALASRMTQIAVQYDLDLFHVHYAIPHAVSGFLAREAEGGRFKLITTLHGTDAQLVGLDPSYHPITRFALEQSDGLIAVSQYLADATRDDFQITRPITVIPNAVDTERFRPNGNTTLRRDFAPDGEPILAHLSNFRPVKRVPDVIRAFAAILRKRPARLLLLGDGPERPAAEQLACELGVYEHIHFLGPVNEVERFLALADLFLLLSEIESFGLAALEAMACGVPVLGYRVGGVPELVVEGEVGYLAEVGDWNAVAAQALRLFENPSRLAEMKTAARALTEAKFTLTPFVRAHVDYYERVLRGAPLPA